MPSPASTPPRPRGRPRLSPSPTESTATDIVAAAGRLFTRSGYSVSTRAIAEAAGVRQASLYHHFPTKDAILLTLVTETIQPTLEVARTLVSDGAAPAAKLWALCAWDVAHLVDRATPAGSLYLMPELRAEAFAPFWENWADLRSHYGALVEQTGAHDPESATDLVIGLVESVLITQHRSPERLTSATPAILASTALRMIGLPESAEPGASVLHRLSIARQEM